MSRLNNEIFNNNWQPSLAGYTKQYLKWKCQNSPIKRQRVRLLQSLNGQIGMLVMEQKHNNSEANNNRCYHTNHPLSPSFWTRLQFSMVGAHLAFVVVFILRNNNMNFLLLFQNSCLVVISIRCDSIVVVSVFGELIVYNSIAQLVPVVGVFIVTR